MSAALDGVYEFHSRDISHEFMGSFIKNRDNIQNSFLSADNNFIKLEMKHDKIVGKINSRNGKNES